MNKNLTIILTVFGREEFTQRWLAFQNFHKCDYPILIVDSKGDPYFKDGARLKKDYPHLDCSYYFLENHGIENIEFYFKFVLQKAVSLVDTEYFILDDNDNFIVSSNLEKSINFLDDHQDYSSARGNGYRFWFHEKWNIDPLYKLFGQQFITIKPDHLSVENDDPFKRITWMLNNTDSDNNPLLNWYSVFRTSQGIKVLSAIANADGFDPYFAELFILIGYSNLGKSIVLNHTHWIQQHGSSESLAQLLAEYTAPIDRVFMENNLNYLDSFLESFDQSFKNKESIKTTIYNRLLNQHVRRLQKKKSFINTLKNSNSTFVFVLYRLRLLLDYFLRKKKYFKLHELDSFFKHMEKKDV